jgi:hypothetical protein
MMTLSLFIVSVEKGNEEGERERKNPTCAVIKSNGIQSGITDRTFLEAELVEHCGCPCQLVIVFAKGKDRLLVIALGFPLSYHCSFLKDFIFEGNL